MYVHTRKKRIIFSPGGVKTTPWLSVCLSVCLSARPNNPADSSPFHHLGTKLQTKTCAQQVTFCPSCPNRYLCNPWSVSRDSTPFVQIYMRHGRIPGLSAGRRHFVFLSNKTPRKKPRTAVLLHTLLLLDRVHGQGGRDTHTHTAASNGGGSGGNVWLVWGPSLAVVAVPFSVVVQHGRPFSLWREREREGGESHHNNRRVLHTPHSESGTGAGCALYCCCC